VHGIERLIGLSEGLGGATPEPMLRRHNLVRTVQATAAIEGNTLSLDQVTAVLQGKRVRGPAREIREIKNALAAYEIVRRSPASYCAARTARACIGGRSSTESTPRKSRDGTALRTRTRTE
jgi:hypothetical protein